MTTAAQYDAYAGGAIWLVEVLSATPVYRALYAGPDVSYDGKTWSGENGAFSERVHAIDGSKPQTELSLQNVRSPAGTSPAWSDADLRAINGTEVRFHLWHPSQGLLRAEVRWYISGARADGEYVRFRLTSPADALLFEAPRHPLGSKRCGWVHRYQSHPCDSKSDKPTCSGSLSDCIARFPGTYPRFGPSFPFYTRHAAGRR